MKFDTRYAFLQWYTNLFLDNIVLGMEVGWSIRNHEDWESVESVKSTCQLDKCLIFSTYLYTYWENSR